MNRLAIPLVLLIFLEAGCASSPSKNDQNFGDNPIPSGEYQASFDKWTNSEKAYRGGAQALQVTATLQSRDVIEQHVFIDAKRYHWSSDQYREARQKELYKNESATSFFLVLYTEKDENNNIDKPDSVWNIFLDVAGKRIAPSSIKRIYENKTILFDKYPYINVWSKNYTVEFPIPTSETTSATAVLTVAGALGAVHLDFPK